MKRTINFYVYMNPPPKVTHDVNSLTQALDAFIEAVDHSYQDPKGEVIDVKVTYRQETK